VTHPSIIYNFAHSISEERGIQALFIKQQIKNPNPPLLLMTLFFGYFD
jgi:hypothetical protein